MHFFLGMIMAADNDLSKLYIVNFPHPTLRYVSKPIRRVDNTLKEIVARMFELMYEHRGVGLAANQVDLPFRLFIMNSAGEKDEGIEHVFINPVISRPRGREELEEGCLSLPEIHATVHRAQTIHFNAFDLNGQEVNQDISGFEARIIQHETDHLNGTLFIDRLRESQEDDLSGSLHVLEIDYQSRQRVQQIPSDEALVSQLKNWEDKYC